MTQSEYPLFVVLVNEGDYWSYDAPFKTLEEAKEEIRSMIQEFTEGSVNPKDFVVAPNNFEKLKAFRPLDYGDAMYTGKPRGNPDNIIIWRGDQP